LTHFFPAKASIDSINCKVIPGENKKMYKGNRLLLPWYEVRNPGLKKKSIGENSPGCLFNGEWKNHPQVWENLQ
jgi:hypothetical protein